VGAVAGTGSVIAVLAGRLRGPLAVFSRRAGCARRASGLLI
jgi:hypothetical protein